MDEKAKSTGKSAREKKNHLIPKPVIKPGVSLHWMRRLVRIWGKIRN